MSGNFFATLPGADTPRRTFADDAFARAPDDWLLVVTDVRDSTGAFARGQHRTVNFVAAAAIAALKNLYAPESLPFLFAGDGVVVLLPPGRDREAAVTLARLRGFARREFGLELRVGIAPVAAVRAEGGDVEVARYEPTSGNSFGVFRGGGVAVFERALKGSPDGVLARHMVVPEALDDGELIDITGLSCRWDALQSTRGKMASVILRADHELGTIYDEVVALARRDGDPKAVKPQNLRPKWPPEGFLIEARARRREGPLFFVALKILAVSLLTAILLRRHTRLGSFDPDHYVHEIVSNTDFCRHDDTVSFVLDCAPDTIEEIRAHLERQKTEGRLRYGLHTSDTALMTCLVSSLADHLHVHFIDGGDGGYTAASRSLKDTTPA